MGRRKKVGLKVRVSGDTAFVSTTDIRTNFTAIYDRVLRKYPTIVVERNGQPVAVLKRPSEVEAAVTVEEF
ncbi:MAG: type II toxin-antitoxin system Phd/YefM family antitoxin [Gemmatimonadota bacterium]